MRAIVEKQVHITETRAKRLEELAALRGATEDMLIEQGVDLLFVKLADESELEPNEEDDWHLLARLEAETGHVPYNTRPVFKIDPGDIVSIVETPVPAGSLRRNSARGFDLGTIWSERAQTDIFYVSSGQSTSPRD